MEWRGWCFSYFYRLRTFGYSNPLVWEVRTAKLIVAQSSLQDNQVVAARKVAKHSESSLNDLHSGLKDYEIDCGHIRSFIWYLDADSRWHSLLTYQLSFKFLLQNLFFEKIGENNLIIPFEKKNTNRAFASRPMGPRNGVPKYVPQDALIEVGG